MPGKNNLRHRLRISHPDTPSTFHLAAGDCFNPSTHGFCDEGTRVNQQANGARGKAIDFDNKLGHDHVECQSNN